MHSKKLGSLCRIGSRRKTRDALFEQKQPIGRVRPTALTRRRLFTGPRSMHVASRSPEIK
jgi:hypothetical protein